MTAAPPSRPSADGSAGRYNAMIAGPSGVAFAPGDNGSLAKTTDGGKTWTRGNVSTSEDVSDVSFPTATDGFALDSAGGLFRTNDGGGTWRALDTGSTALPARRAGARPQDGPGRRARGPAPLDRRR